MTHRKRQHYPWAMRLLAYTLVRDQGLSHREVAERLNVKDPSTVCHWVKSLDTPNDPRIPKPRRSYVQMVRQMGEGDSVLIETEEEGRRLYRAILRMGFAAHADKEGTGLRVWKIKNLNDR